MPDIRIGTIGFSYPEWKSVFYPPGTKDLLPFYASCFDSVELDTTFHAIPPADRVQSWHDQSPDNFLFVLKAPRLITHENTLEKAGPDMHRFLTVAQNLQSKLAAVLLQFPPTFSADRLPALTHFIEHFQPMIPRANFIVEFRNASWNKPPAFTHMLETLKRLNVSLAAADYGDSATSLLPTSDLLFLRFVGQRDEFGHDGREKTDRHDRLHYWLDQLTPHLPSAKRVLIYFSNDFTGYAIPVANRMKSLPHLPIQEPTLKKSPTDPQSTLF